MASTYSVYEHVFPNGKKYIGITSTDPEKRWLKGNGYKTQPKMWHAIESCGWENIKHNVVASGLTKEDAENLEQYLIANLDTIGNGYNVAIGGDAGGNATFLCPYLMTMIRSYKRYYDVNSSDWTDSFAKLCYESRYNKEEADYWNEATFAVVRKWREYSPTNYDDVDAFWWHISEYERLYQWSQRGFDTDEWYEVYPPWEHFDEDMFMRVIVEQRNGRVELFSPLTDRIDPETLQVVTEPL